MTNKILPVALVQETNHGNAEANLAVIEQRVAEAARQGAKLVLLQELHNGAYFCQRQDVCEFDLAEASTDAPELLLAEVDLQRSEHVRRIWPFLRDRRIDAYGDLVKRYRD